MSVKLTQEEYVDKMGCSSPICGGGVESDGHGLFRQDDGFAWQSVKCPDCGAKWVDQYKLAGFSDVETAEGTARSDLLTLDGWT